VSAKLNLSSYPFRNRKLPWAVTLLICLFSLLALSFIIAQSWTVNSQALKAEKELEPLKQQKSALEQKAKEVNEGLTSEQRQLLNAGHSLVNRKRFSWSHFFNEIESIMPSSVKVSRIDVRDVKVGGGRMIADLEFAVISKSDVSVTNMIAGMNNTGVFQTELVNQDLRKENNETVTEWTMHVIYTPRHGIPVNDEPNNSLAGVSRANGGGNQ